MAEEFNISLKYLDPKFYEKDNLTGFLKDCKNSRRLESPAVQAEFLESFKNSLRESKYNPNVIWSHTHFDGLQQMCSKFPNLKTAQKSNLAFILCETGENLIAKIDSQTNLTAEEKAALRNAFKIVSFLCCMLVNASEKAEKKKHSDWDWHFERENVFGVLISLLRCKNSKKLWRMNTPEEEFGNMLFKTAVTVFEGDHSTQRESPAVFEMIGLNLKKNGFLQLTFSATFTHLLLNTERFSKKVANLCVFVVEKYALDALIGGIIREIGRLDDNNLSKNIKGAESIGLFLMEISARLPQLVHQNVAGLESFLKGNCYKMRNGVLQVFGELILHLEETLERDDAEKRNGENGENAENSENAEDSEKENAKKSKGESSGEILEKVGRLLDLIEERVWDVVSYTRSKALQVMKKLVDQQSIPSSQHLVKIVKICRKKLGEKNTNVRKNAASLLSLIIVKNYPEDPIAFKKRYSQLTEILDALNKAEESIELTKKEEETPKTDHPKKLSPESRQKLLKEYESVKNACEFLEEVERCLPAARDVFSLKGNFDVIECIALFREAAHRAIPGWKGGFKKMFALIWNKEAPNIVEAVLEAYYQKYILGGAEQQRKGSAEIARSLARMVGELESYRELTCIEELILMMAARDRIPRAVVHSLWDIFQSQTDPNQNTKEVAKTANDSLFILSVVATQQPSAVASGIDPLLAALRRLFVDRPPNCSSAIEMTAAISHCFRIIEKCHKKKALSPSTQSSVRALGEAILFEAEMAEHRWFGAAQRICSALFAVLPAPHGVFEALLRRFGGERDLRDAAELSKFFFLLGGVALNSLALLERRETLLKNAKAKKDRLELMAEESGEKRQSSVVSDYYKINEGEKEYQIEQMRERAESSMVQADLVGRYGRLVVFICRRLGDFDSKRLRCSAVLSLCKFMCIGKEFCAQNLELLLSLIAEEKDSVLITNAIISLGDIASRFPNLTSPHISKMFAPLHHKEVSVRKNTLLVVAHLILNDMIKVKESISEIALAIRDPEKSVRDLAKLFFQEFSKKGKNPIYNTLPDIISKLTHEKVSRVTFDAVVKELIRYISEEKQQESLIHKICTRFSKLKDKEQIYNNVHCLTLLAYGEKCTKKLIELSRTFKSLLDDQKIFDCFKVIVAKAKKAASKQEVKDMILEFEETVIKRPHMFEDNSESVNGEQEEFVSEGE